MGFFEAIAQLFSLIIMFLGKCVEHLFISILFALPLWFVYSKFFMFRFDLPTLYYVDFVAGLFCFQLIGVIWMVATGGVTKNKIIFTSPKNNDLDKIENE